MQGMRKRASGGHDTYTTKLSAVATMSDGQLEALYASLVDVLHSNSLDSIDKAHQAGLIYIQMLRVTYTVDRVSSLHKAYLFQHSDKLDYASGVAHPNMHEFLQQVDTWDYFIGLQNRFHLQQNRPEEAEANRTISDQLQLWIKNAYVSDISKPGYVLSASELGSMENALKAVSTESVTQRQLYDDWANVLHMLRNNCNLLLGGKSRKAFALSESQVSRLCSRIQHSASQPAVSMDKDNSFVLHFMRMDSGRQVGAWLPEIHQKIMAAVQHIGKAPETIHTSPTLSNLFEKKGEYRAAVASTDNDDTIIFNHAILPLLTYLQYAALKQNITQNNDQMGLTTDLLMNVVRGDEVVYPTQIHASHMQTLKYAMDTPQFLENTLYVFYQDIYAQVASGALSKETLQTIHTYTQSNNFIGHAKRLREYAEQLGYMDRTQDAGIYSYLSRYVENFACTLSLLASKEGLLPQDQWASMVRNALPYYLMPTPTAAVDVGAFNQNSFSTLMALDRSAYYVTKPLTDVEGAMVLLREHPLTIKLPSCLQATIVCDYLLFDGKVDWPNQTPLLNQVFQALQDASTQGIEQKGMLTIPYTVEPSSQPMWFSAWLGKATQTISVKDHQAIFSCIATKQYYALHTLLQRGCRLDVTNKAGRTPLQEATYLNDVEAVQRIMYAMMSQAQRALPTALAVQHNSTAVLQYYIDVLGVDTMRPTLLHEAVQYGHIEAVQVLRQAGFAIDVRDVHNKTPLDYVGIDNAALRHALQNPVSAQPSTAPDKKRNVIEQFAHHKQRFFARSKGPSTQDVWLKRVMLVLWVGAVTCFALSFAFPINLLLNLTVLFSYAALFLGVAYKHFILPTKTKVGDVMAQSQVFGQPIIAHATPINPSLLYSYDVMGIPESKVIPVTSNTMRIDAVEKVVSSAAHSDAAVHMSLVK